MALLANIFMYARQYFRGGSISVSIGNLWGWESSRDVVLIVAAMAVLATVLNYFVGPALKVILDIFRYAVDGPYRRLLLKELDSVLGKIEPGIDDRRRIAVVAHSLGTVIAVDSLVSSSCWGTADSVVLVTMGSPLKRFFFRFFPNLFFPGSAFDSARIIASRVAAFRWINCYRPWDQVGTRIGLPENAGLHEECTGL
jgi:hypothetical protein